MKSVRFEKERTVESKEVKARVLTRDFCQVKKRAKEVARQRD